MGVYVGLEVEGVVETKKSSTGGFCTTVRQGEGVKPDFFTVYARVADEPFEEGETLENSNQTLLAEALEDRDTHEEAVAVAEKIAAEHGNIPIFDAWAWSGTLLKK